MLFRLEGGVSWDGYWGGELGRGRTITGKHVLGVSTVSRAPCFVCEGVDFSRAVVALVEGYGDKTDCSVFPLCRTLSLVPFVDCRRGNWFHTFLGLEARVEEP